MNLLERRREMMKKSDPYKDYIKIWLTTTTANASQQVVYRDDTTRLEDVAVDGVSVGAISPVTFAAAGDHTLYIKFLDNQLTYNNLYWRQYKVVEIPQVMTHLAGKSIVVIIHPWILRFLSPTPPTVTGSTHILWGADSRAPDLVQVPKGSAELYRQLTGFENLNIEEI